MSTYTFMTMTNGHSRGQATGLTLREVENLIRCVEHEDGADLTCKVCSSNVEFMRDLMFPGHAIATHHSVLAVDVEIAYRNEV